MLIAYDCPLIPGALEAVLDFLTDEMALTPWFPDELARALRALSPFSVLKIDYISMVAVVPDLNVYWNLFPLPTLTTESPFLETSGRLSPFGSLAPRVLWW